jgi:hypothetical protein
MMKNIVKGGLDALSGKAPRPKQTIEPPKVKSTGPTKSRIGLIGITSWHKPEVHQMLKIIAAENNKTQAELMAEAFNILFERYKKPRIA